MQWETPPLLPRPLPVQLAMQRLLPVMRLRRRVTPLALPQGTLLAPWATPLPPLATLPRPPVLLLATPAEPPKLLAPPLVTLRRLQSMPAPPR